MLDSVSHDVVLSHFDCETRALLRMTCRSFAWMAVGADEGRERYAHAVRIGDTDVVREYIAHSTASDVNLAAAEGHVEVLKLLRSHDMNEITMSVSASMGRVHVLDWLLDQGVPHDWRVLMQAASRGHCDVVKWAFARACMHSSISQEVGHHIVRAAAKNGQDDVVACIHAIHPLWIRPSNILFAATPGGHMRLIKWTTGVFGSHLLTQAMLDRAARHGRIALMKFIVESTSRAPSINTATSAAYGGHVDVLVWIVSGGYPIDYRMCRHSAIHGGSIAVLEWCVHMSPPSQNEWSDMNTVWHHGFASIDMMMWGCRRGWALPPDACARTVHTGDVRALEFAKRNGAVIDSWTLCRAARYGRTDAVSWLLENDCPCHLNPMLWAASGGTIDTVDQLLLHGVGQWYSACSREAAHRGHMHLLHHIAGIGMAWMGEGDERLTCLDFVQHGRIEWLMWARAGGCEWNEDTAAAVAARGWLHMLKYMRSTDPPCPWDERVTCILNDRVIIDWAILNGCPSAPALEEDAIYDIEIVD